MSPDLDRVAVITDIHGNLPALQAALARIEELGIESVFCGGDLIAERRLPMIYGNYDFAIARDLEDCGCAYVTAHDRELGQRSVDWTLAHTSQDSKDFMRGLPFDLHFPSPSRAPNAQTPPQLPSARTSAPPTSSPARLASPTPRSPSGACSPTPSPASRPYPCPATWPRSLTEERARSFS